MVIPRHEGHHHHDHSKDKKWGYLTLLLSILYLVYLYVSNYIHSIKWLKSGRSTGGKNWVLPGLWLRLLVFVAFSIVICLWGIDKETFKSNFRRFGRVAYCLVPLNIFLTFKPAVITGTNYLDLLGLHKWLSRWLMVMAIVHSVGFTVVWIVNQEVSTWSKLFQFNNLLGAITCNFSILLLVVSTKPIRRIMYQFFYLFHNVTMWLWVFAIIYHSRWEVTSYGALCGLLLAYQLYQRVFCVVRNLTPLNFLTNGEHNLSLIRLPNPNKFSFEPGSHLRVYKNHSISKFWNWFLPSHPYSIVAMDMTSISLVVKGYNMFNPHVPQQYTISTKLYNSIHPNIFKTAENVVIVCGGSGISFGLPIYQHFLQNSGNLDLVPYLCWIVRSDSELYLLDELKVKGIEVFVTTGSGESVFNLEEEMLLADEIELESLEQTEEKENKVHRGGRPDLRGLIAPKMASTMDKANKWVVSCGPEGLVAECNKIAKQMKVQSLSEVYSM
ncbi:unnamed protein product [Kuraishia capsulata CBS 1993]|uniref:Probable metalloreductase AIM14 n=1 Tax=Kuraishia capsulata CBS 1993 TaxID=1382522 RepID=W6MSZ0_9ASCO|nr:uncharacterized protein KUCA_T00005833001 [Kuraishia capsulata CBS 1993]CDK29839.1 unnamed protein product [Kuraishia capsulata CBS 1993]